MNIRLHAKFWVAYARCEALTRLNTSIVKAHLMLTPSSSTTDTLTEIALEKTALWHRKLAQKTYVERCKAARLAQEILGEK